MIRFWTGLMFLFLSGSVQAQQEDLFSVPNTLKYAVYLEETGDRDLALAEYERILFLDPSADTVRFRILSLLLKSGNEKLALTRSSSFLSQYQSKICEGKTKHGKLMLLGGNPDSALIYFREKACPDSVGLYLAEVSSLLFSCRFPDARNAAGKYSSTVKNKLPQFTSFINDSLKLRKRSSLLAGGMSAVLPGSGKMYTGRWEDGFYSLLIIASNAYASYRYFHKQGMSSAGGWIFAGIGTGFYLGNVYGSVKAAKVFNRNEKARIRNSIRRRIVASF